MEDERQEEQGPYHGHGRAGHGRAKGQQQRRAGAEIDDERTQRNTAPGPTPVDRKRDCLDDHQRQYGVNDATVREEGLHLRVQR